MNNNNRLMRIFVSVTILLMLASRQAAAQNEPYRNPDLTPNERAWDLVKRMTLDEKISQMINGAHPIERLGIRQYDWWNEALHGVARAGLATVFPQTIGMAVTVPASAFERYDDKAGKVTVKPGAYEILYGGTSADEGLKKVSLSVR